MIRFNDALKLSVTKLRTRRIRLIIMTIVSGLLFIALVMASLLFNGFTDSIDDFSKDGLGGRYIVKISPVDVGSEGDFYTSKDLITSAKKADKQLVADKKAEAKRLGITYDAASDFLSVTPEGPENPESLSPAWHVNELIKQHRIDKSKPFFKQLDDSLAGYDVVGRHFGATIVAGQIDGSGSGDTAVLSAIKNGKELSPENEEVFKPGFASITSGLTALDESVLGSFVLPGQNLTVESKKPIPVIAPFSAVEEALGFSPLVDSATSEQKLARLQEVRQKATGTVMSVCLRNQTSYNRQLEATSQQKDIKQNKDKPDYIAPELQTKVSQKACQDVETVRDVRSAETKTYDTKQKQFDQKFGQQPAKQRLVNFRIAGISPDGEQFDSGFSVSSILGAIVTANVGNGWFVPVSAQSELPEYKSYWDVIGKVASYDEQVLIEFASAADAKRYAKEQSCVPDFELTHNFAASCKDKGKPPFTVDAYGSNSVAIDDARNWFNKTFVTVALVVAGISAIIMMGTVGKVIADSRRETAVFRAIGAKRTDIALVYTLYALLLGLIVAGFALFAGGVFAGFIHSRYTADLTVEALTIFNSQDLQKDFLIARVNLLQLATLVAVILLAGLASAVLPLLNNLKRNPIKDMRDER